MSELRAKVNHDMTEQEYRNHPGVNKSTLWEIRKSPMHYKWALEHPSEDTPALRMGRAIHMAVLQPERFCENYAVAPDGIDRRTKAGKEEWAAFMVQAGEREILTGEENEEIKAIANAVRSQFRGLLDGCVTEVPLFWDDPRTGIGCKCRVDAMKEMNDRFVMIDLKSTGDAEIGAFTRSAVKLGYHVQAAHYINGARTNGLNHGKPIEWYFLAVEKKEPYVASLIRADDGLIDEGQFKLMSLMGRLDECLRTNEWPGYGETVMTMPAWAVEEPDED